MTFKIATATLRAGLPFLVLLLIAFTAAGTPPSPGNSSSATFSGPAQTSALGVFGSPAVPVPMSTAHFFAEGGFGGFSFHNYGSSTLGDAAGWPSPSVVGACSSGGNVDVEATGGTASAGYATLKLAFDAINAGTHTGAISMEVCANTNEGATPAVLHSTGAGSANYTSINIYPLQDSLNISGAMPSGRGVIELNGADNVTIDGDNPLTAGTNRNLTIQNTAANTVTFGQVIRIALNTTTVASANNCSFKNLSLLGNASGRNASGAVSSTGSENTSYGIYVSGNATGATTAPSPITATGTTVGGSATASSLSITNNTVTNAARAVALQGAAVTVFPNLLIDNNLIGNPTPAAADQVYSTGMIVQGSNGGAIQSNTIYVEGFVNTQLRGIEVGGGSNLTTAISIEGNRILRVRNNHPQTRGAYGVNLNGGSGHFVRNNFVADIRNDQTSGQNVFNLVDGAFGIRAFIGSGHVILHNSVHLSGSIPGSMGSTLTAALAVNGTSNSGLDIRNNIFSNQLAGGNPTGITHAAVYLPSGANEVMNVLWNNNAYFQGAGSRNRLAQVGTTFGSGEFTAANFNPASNTPAANFRSVTSILNGDGTNDNASFALAGAPPFASDTDLHVSGAAPLESGGTNAGIGSDIDGDPRNATTPDIGADEFSGGGANQPPTITSTAPTSATEDVLLTYNAASTDADGPGAVWSLLPAHSCGGSVGAATGVLTFTVAGPVPPVSCTLAIQVCDGGSPDQCASQSATVTITAGNDAPIAVDDDLGTTQNTPLIVSASSLASNDIDPDGPGLTVTAVSNPLNGTVNLSAGSVTFTPTSGFVGTAGFDYTVSDGSLTDTGHVGVTVTPSPFSGSVSVGTGEAITSLTNDGGLFQQMNAGTIGGNLTVNITSDLTAETGTHALNQLTESGAGNWTVKFQASGGVRVVSGSNGTALITLNGADRVTFSGEASGPNGLILRNTGTGATIRYMNDAVSNTILNCIVEGGTAGSTSGVVFIGDGPVTGNDNISIITSTIRDRTDAEGVPASLIYVSGAAAGGPVNSDLAIINNQIRNFASSGIFVDSVENSTIRGNVISQTAARSTELVPIQLQSGSGENVIAENTIRDQSTDAAFAGMYLLNNSGTLNVNRNRIFDIDNLSPGAVTVNGVQLAGGGTLSLSLVNNMVSVVPSAPGSQVISGVRDDRAAGTLNMHHNSVHVGGTGTGTYAYLRGPGSTSSVSLIGNILFNSGTGGNSFAVADESPGAGSWTSDYNLFVGTGPAGADFFSYGGSPVGFAAWQSGTPPRDANSIASLHGVGPFNVGNMFVSANDLHLQTAGNNPAVNSGTDVGVSLDFDGQARPFNGVPDIGADEVQTAPTSADASIGGRVLTADGRGIRNIRVVVTGGDLAKPITAITNSFGYYRVDGLRAGESYVVSVGGKRYAFETPSRLVSLGEDALDVNFVGQAR